MAANTLTLRGLTLRRKSDEDVFARALAGDEVAFAEVYRRYYPRIFGFCLARSLDPHAAADAAQDVFVKLLKAEPGSITSPKSWLFTVARNAVTDRFREAGSPSAAVPTAGDSPSWDALPSSAAADDEAVSRETASNVYLALRRMRPRYRTALVLREIHGETSAAMAEALETTPGAVDTLVSRARDSFGAMYAEVSGFPAECRTAVELAYRRTGTGIDDAQNARLEVHLETCPDCRREAARAEQPASLAAFLPFLASASGSSGRSLLSRALSMAQSAPGQIGLQIASSDAGRLTTALRAGTLALAVAVTFATPFAAYHAGVALSGRTGRSFDGKTTSLAAAWAGPSGMAGARMGADVNVPAMPWRDAALSEMRTWEMSSKAAWGSRAGAMPAGGSAMDVMPRAQTAPSSSPSGSMTSSGGGAMTSGGSGSSGSGSAGSGSSGSGSGAGTTGSSSGGSPGSSGMGGSGSSGSGMH